MKRSDWQKVYAPQGSALDVRVQHALASLGREPERKTDMRMKRVMAAVLACMAMAVGAAAGGLFAPEYDAVRLADTALAEAYGVTDEMQTYFSREVREEDGVTIVVYRGMEDMRHVLGSYTVTIRGGKAAASWSLDGQSTQGGLDAQAWGAEQLEILLQMAADEQGFARGHRKALEILREGDGLEVTETYEDESGQTQTEQIRLPADSMTAAVTEEQALQIAVQALAQRFALTPAQQEKLEYNRDYAEYTCAVLDGRMVYELWFWMHQDEAAYHTAGDGLYRAIIDAQTGEIMDLMYDSALAGNG